MPSFNTTVHPVEGNPYAVEVRFTGQLTADAATQVREAIEKAVAGKACLLLLGLKGVAFLPSITLSHLADVLVRLERRGGAVHLVETDPKVRIVMESLGLSELFKFDLSMEDAIQAAAASAARIPTLPRVEISMGPREGQAFLLGDEPLTMGGHADCWIRIQSPRVDPQHARIEKRDGRFHLIDVSTKGGVFVGRNAVKEAPLSDGDTLMVWDFMMKVRLPG